MCNAGPRAYIHSMSASCCGPDHHHIDPNRGNEGYRRVLWAVLAINAIMFLVEIAAGLAAGSASLQADAVDFFGDAANYDTWDIEVDARRANPNPADLDEFIRTQTNGKFKEKVVGWCRNE